MNLITHITPEHPLLGEKCSLTHLVYLYLISDVSADGEDLYCNFFYADILDKFSRTKGVEESHVIDTIKWLHKSDFVRIDGTGDETTVYVGTKIGKTNKLFIGTSANVNDIKETLLQLASAWNDSAAERSTAQMISRDLGVKVTELFNKKPETWSTLDFFSLYQHAYNAYFQATARTEYNNVEINKMKNFAKLFDNSTVIRMIVKYITNFTGKGEPSIGQMMYLKDELYAKVHSVSREKVERVTRKEHVRF